MTSAAGTDQKRRRRGETKQKLLDAAISVFARHGYDRATVDEIVKEAGFSKGAFYVHFESKEDLFWELLQDRIEAQQRALWGAVDPKASLAQNELRILNSILNMERVDPFWPAIFMEFAAHAGRNEEVRKRMVELYDRWHTFTVAMLKAGQETGTVRADLDLDFSASLIIAILQGSILQSKLGTSRSTLTSRLDRLANAIAELLEPRPGS
jgi:AcrR family transcriptional regulator